MGLRAGWIGRIGQLIARCTWISDHQIVGQIERDVVGDARVPVKYGK